MMENCYIVESSAIPVTSTESHALTCAIFDATPVPFAINDQYGRIVMLNRAFVETIGYTLEDIPTLSDWWPLAYPDAGYRQWVTDNWQKNFAASARSQCPFVPLEINIHCKGGRIRRFMASASPMGEGLDGNHLVILYDITERHRAEEAVKAMESAALFEATFNQAAVGLAHLSLDGKWLRVNEKICHILGYSREELLEMTFQDITYADDLEMTLACVEQMLSGEIGTFVKDIRYLHKRGTIAWMRLTVSLTKKGDGAPDYFISVIEDITEQKQAAAELIRLRAQADIFLEQQILAQTIMALAHELNQPLNAAGSYNEAALRLIKMEQINTAKLTEVIKCAVAEIQRTGNVMRNLMKNIHQNIQDSEVFELNGSLHEAVKAFNAAMYENSALVVLENSGGEVQVSVKRLCLEKVLMNLLWNAQQAIAVKADMSVDPVITIRVAYQQDCVVVSVIDNGPPISQPVADKLFNPFFTTKLNGVGMGLPISRALIESCGGKLWYAAVEGKTAFHFSLKKIVEIQDDAVVASDQGGHRRVNEGDRRTKHDRRNF